VRSKLTSDTHRWQERSLLAGAGGGGAVTPSATIASRLQERGPAVSQPDSSDPQHSVLVLEHGILGRAPGKVLEHLLWWMDSFVVAWQQDCHGGAIEEVVDASGVGELGLMVDATTQEVDANTQRLSGTRAVTPQRQVATDATHTRAVARQTQSGYDGHKYLYPMSSKRSEHHEITSRSSQGPVCSLEPRESKQQPKPNLTPNPQPLTNSDSPRPQAPTPNSAQQRCKRPLRNHSRCAEGRMGEGGGEEVRDPSKGGRKAKTSNVTDVTDEAWNVTDVTKGAKGKPDKTWVATRQRWTGS
jgi:hypothetical protein